MDAIIALILGLLAAAATYVFKDKELKDAKAERDFLDLQLKKEVKKQKAREAAIRTATAKVAYEETKKRFMDRYADVIAKSGSASSASDGDADES